MVVVNLAAAAGVAGVADGLEPAAGRADDAVLVDLLEAAVGQVDYIDHGCCTCSFVVVVEVSFGIHTWARPWL